MDPTHYELDFEGAPLFARGFLHGVAAARGKAGEIHFGGEVGYRDAGWLDRLLADLVGRAATTRVVVSGPLREAIQAALAAAPAGLPIHEVRAARVVGAHFHARVVTFSEPLARKIRARLEAPPPGVELVGYRPTEEHRPEGKGIEIYTPEHDYGFAAEFDVRGDFAGVAALHRFCRQEEVIQEGEVVLDVEE